MAAAGPVITPFSADKKHTDIERWICIYPAYLNSKKTLQEGRKIPKSKSVENPAYLEIRDVLQASNFKIVLENKLYPREKSKVRINHGPVMNKLKLTEIFQELLYRGRIRVQLKDAEGQPLNDEFPTRDSILVHLGAMIPQLKSRQGGGGGGGAAGQGQSSAQATSSHSHHHKKGKGKRR